jgi:type IV secretion system protein VirD4
LFAVSSFRTYGLQAVCCFLIALICLWAATEWTASLSGTPPIRARKLHYYRDRNFLERRLASPERAAGRKAGRGASHDWAGFLRTPHPGLEREGSELVAAGDEHHEDGPRDRQATVAVPHKGREDTPDLFAERAASTAREADDDSARIELPGGVRLS